MWPAINIAHCRLQHKANLFWWSGFPIFLRNSRVGGGKNQEWTVNKDIWFLLCGLWFYTTGASFKVFPYSLSSCFFILFSIVITLLVEEGAGLCASRAFVCLFVYVLVFVIFLFSLSWCRGLAAVCDCGTPWTFLLTFLKIFGCIYLQFCYNFVLIQTSPKKHIYQNLVNNKYFLYPKLCKLCIMFWLERKTDCLCVWFFFSKSQHFRTGEVGNPKNLKTLA